MLKRAAEIHGRTLTDFVVTAARDAAQSTIEDAGIIRLSVSTASLPEPRGLYLRRIASPVTASSSLRRR